MDPRILDAIYTQLGLTGLILLAVAGAFWKLHAELRTTRIEVAYQLNRDLIGQRLAAYGQLWARMQDLALYSTSRFGPSEARACSERLSEWYFSATGGLYLSRRARDFYFALQDLLRGAPALGAWRCDERPNAIECERLFKELLAAIGPARDDDPSELVALLQRPEAIDTALWLRVCRRLPDKLRSVVETRGEAAGVVIFACIQQVSSVLRSNLTAEMHTRLDFEWPQT